MTVPRQEPLIGGSWGWDPSWPMVGTTAREDLPSGGHSIWVVSHGYKEPRWVCLDSTGPGYIREVATLVEGSVWRVIGRVPGTPVWPVAAAYPRGLS